MLHPSYAELMKVVNEDVQDDSLAVNSRYSIVLATARRARQLIDGRKPLSKPAIDKPLSIAVDELSKGLIKIVPGEQEEELEIGEMEQDAPVSELDTAVLQEDDAPVPEQEDAALEQPEEQEDAYETDAEEA